MGLRLAALRAAGAPLLKGIPTHDVFNIFFSFLYKTSVFHVSVRLYSNRSVLVIKR